MAFIRGTGDYFNSKKDAWDNLSTTGILLTNHHHYEADRQDDAAGNSK